MMARGRRRECFQGPCASSSPPCIVESTCHVFQGRKSSRALPILALPCHEDGHVALVCRLRYGVTRGRRCTTTHVFSVGCGGSCYTRPGRRLMQGGRWRVVTRKCGCVGDGNRQRNYRIQNHQVKGLFIPWLWRVYLTLSTYIHSSN